MNMSVILPESTVQVHSLDEVLSLQPYNVHQMMRDFLKRKGYRELHVTQEQGMYEISLYTQNSRMLGTDYQSLRTLALHKINKNNTNIMQGILSLTMLRECFEGRVHQFTKQHSNTFAACARTLNGQLTGSTMNIYFGTKPDTARIAARHTKKLFDPTPLLSMALVF